MPKKSQERIRIERQLDDAIDKRTALMQQQILIGQEIASVEQWIQMLRGFLQNDEPVQSQPPRRKRKVEKKTEPAPPSAAWKCNDCGETFAEPNRKGPEPRCPNPQCTSFEIAKQA